MARLFISHSSRNNDKAVEVRDWLAKNGWDDVFLDLDPERGIVAGQRWKDALQKAAQRCEMVLALISAEWLASPWCKAEIDAARLMGKKVIVALIGIDKAQVPPDLTDEQWIDLTSDPNAYTRLREGLRRGGLDPSSFPFEAGRRPYPGFASLEENDAAIFFGRDAQIVRGLDKIRGLVRAGVDRMLVILGASGSGKSSFFRAGLWPRLKRDDRTWLPLPTIRPERAVISGKYGLVQSLQQVMSAPQFVDGIRQRGLPRSRAEIQDSLDKTEDGLVKIFAALRDIAQVPGLSAETTPQPTVILSVDQGEELFNEDGREEAGRFIEILTGTLKADPHALAILVMRSDSFPQLQTEARLVDLPKDTFTLDMMLEGSTRAVIEGPAGLVQPNPLKIDPQLTDALLEDVSGQDALPLLAFTLAHLYENYAADNQLNLADYEKLGRLKGVIATTVREAFAEGVAKGELPKDAKAQLALARKAFIPHLARVNPAGQFVRRIATRAEIPAEARSLIDRFAERRLLIRDRRKIAGEDVEVIEVAHEALLREWDELHHALQEEREFLVAKGQLEEDVAEWQAASQSHKSGALLSGNKLLRARDWLVTRPQELSAEERQFIKASKDKELKQQRLALAAGTLGVLIVAALAILAWSQRNEAVSEANIALARQLAAQAESATSERPNLLERAVLLAVESLKRYPTQEVDQVLRQGLQLLPRAVGRPMKHQGPVQAIAFNRDGTYLATAGREGTAGVWDTVTSQRILTLKPGGVNDRISALAFSPKGAVLATADSGGIAQVWDATSGQPLVPPIKLDAPAESLAFSADGDYLAAVSEHGADVWDVGTNRSDNPRVFSTLPMDEAFPCSPLSSFVFSPNGKYAAASCRGKVRIWETATWNPVVTIPERYRPGLRPPLHPVAFSADGKYLASADDIHDVATGTLVHALSSQEPVSTVAFSQDGDYFAMAAGDIVRLVNTIDGVSFAELHHQREIRAIAISPSGQEMATASKDNTARLWKVNRYAGDGPTQEVTRVSHEGEVSSVAFSSDGKYLATASEDGTARIWQASTVREAGQKIYGDTHEPVVAICSTGRFLAVSAKGLVQVREAVDGREVGRVVYTDSSEPSLEIADASLSQDGRYLWMTVRQPRSRPGRGPLHETQKIARMWTVPDGEVVATIKYEDIPGIAVFSPNARHLVAEDGTTLRVWEVIGGRDVAHIKFETAHVAPVFSPDGSYLAIIEPKAVRVLETNGWREVRSLPISESTFRVVAFSPNSEYIAFGSNKTVDIWEVTGGRTSNSLPVKYATAILFAPDGKHVVTANWNFYDSTDRSVVIWDRKDQREVDRLQLLEIERASNVDSSPTQLAFTIDGRYLAFENQATLRIWDMLTRRETERWVGHYTTQLAFSPDGKYLLSGHGTTASVRRWGPAAIIAEACDRLSRNINPGAEWRQYFGAGPYRKTCPNIQ